MSEFNGTPGPWAAMTEGHYLGDSPWNIEHEDGNDCTWAPVHANGVVVAVVVAEDNDPEADRILDINAKLIAAAPDLLAALTKCLDLRGTLEMHGLLEEVESAIAKATA